MSNHHFRVRTVSSGEGNPLSITVKDYGSTSMPVTNKLRFTGPTSPTLSQVTVTCHRSAEDGLHPAEKITENGDPEKVVTRGV